jgi:hypothetical protein
VNTNFQVALVAVVRDANTNGVQGVTVTFSAPASGAGATFGGSATATAITDNTGAAIAPVLTANGNGGSYAVTATVAGLSGSAMFNLSNTGGTGGSGTPMAPVGLRFFVVPGPPDTGGGGTWTNVTPAGITLDPNGTAAGVGNNYGVQGVHADPSRPGTFYASVTYQGLWKSTDYGLTWSKVTVTSGPNPMDNGRPNIDVASDGTYIISTALYPINGVSNGAWKSTNGGQTWTRYTVGAANGDDMGRFAIDPTDTKRVLGGPHSQPYHMFESRDAGQSWTDQGAPGGATAASLAWIDDNTVLAISDGDNGPGNGTWRGVRSGSVWPWTWTWTRVSTQQHWHGDTQIYIDPATHAIFTGGGFGIQKSTDNGATWTTVSSTNSSSIVGTGTNMYATGNYASLGSFGPYLMHAARASGGTSWVTDSNPPAMNNGWLYAASGLQGSQYVVIGGNWIAGIWRMVEP